ncbi:MAG: dTDP-4-dehydrorhamnose 3,5-epimerase [Candidatus Limnocylindrales bacterium]
MKLEPAGLAGSFRIEPTRIGDDRGFFARIWDDAWAEPLGVDLRNVQTNLSYNRERGTIRGLHWQVEPYGESKLLRCTRGAVYDVAVDVRPSSPTYGRWQGQVIDAESRALVFVPAGCAHGYQALTDDAEVSYQVSHPYVPGSERGIRWDDPSLAIEWPITDRIIVSDKDGAWPDLQLDGAA